MESVLESLAALALGGSGVGAGGEEPEDKPRLLTVEPAPPRQEKAVPEPRNIEVPYTLRLD